MHGLTVLQNMIISMLVKSRAEQLMTLFIPFVIWKNQHRQHAVNVVMCTERAKLRTFWMRSGAEMAPSTRSIRFFSSCMSACLWSYRAE